MIDIMITRLIAAAVAAVLLGWACYVTAFVRHKNDAKDLMNRAQIAGAEVSDWEKIRNERSSSWYLGYRLALVGLIITAAAIGWAAAYLVGEEYVLTWPADCAVAAAGAVIGGMILDKYIIHPIADGRFFEKVEDPLVDYFLENGSLPVKEVKLPRKEKKELKTAAEAAVEEAKDIPPVPASSGVESEVLAMSFDEKVKLLDLIKRNL